MSLAKKIIGNTFIQMFGRVTTALMAIIAVKLITSTLGVEGYGTYATVYEFLALFAVAGDFGIYTVALREMSSAEEREKVKDKNNVDAKHVSFNGREAINRVSTLDTPKTSKGQSEVSFIYQNILGLRITLMIIFMAIAVITAFLIPKYQDTLIPIGVLITSIAVFLNLVNSIATSILQLHLKMTYATISLIIGKIVSIGIIAYGAFFLESNTTAFFSFLIAGILGHLAMLSLSLFYAKKYTNILPKFNFDYWIEIFKKAAPYGVALILGTIYFKVDVFLLSLLRDTDEVGIYAVGIRVVEVFTVLPMFFMNSVLPSLTKAIESGKLSSGAKHCVDKGPNKSNGISTYSKTNKNLDSSIVPPSEGQKLDAILQLSFKFMLVTGLPLVIGSYIVSKFIIGVVSSEEFLSGAKFDLGADVVLYLLMLAMFFSFFSTLISISMVAFKKPIMVLLINFAGVFLNLILNLIYIPKFGYIAAAWTSIISEVLIFILGFLLLQKIHKFVPKLIPNLKIIFAGTLMFLIGFLLKEKLGEGNLQSLLIIISCGVVYSVFIWKLKIVDKKYLELVKN